VFFTGTPFLFDMGLFDLFRKKKKRKKADWLVVGLGNPGDKYAGNRHNIGWMVADALCRKHNTTLRPSSSIYNACSFYLKDNIVLVAQPTTFMNNSGEAVSKLIEEFDIPDGNIIVVIDEYNFPVGKIQLKDSGGSGGHNGMADILDKIPDKKFYRLRCGIAKRFGPGGLVDYVLSDFEPEEIEKRDIMIKKAVIAIEHLITLDNPTRAMSEINSGRIF
jgi:PTH1 family peptidyl-tRNA hydrolase